MRRVQLQFSDEQVAHLEARAAASGELVAAVVRAAVDVQRGIDERRRRIDAALSVVGKYRSGRKDVAERHDDYIAEAIEERLDLEMTVFADTSALYAVLAQDDLHHPEATRLLQWCLEHDDVVTTNYVIVETAQLVRRRLGAEAAADLLDRLLPSMTTIWIDAATHQAASEALRAAGGNASLVDHASFVAMRTAGIEHAMAFDRDFEAQGFTLPAVDEPNAGHQLSEAQETYGAPSDREDLVSVTELSTRSGRSINTVQSWRRRRRDFPTPVAELAAGPIWRWSDVERWIHQHQPARRPGIGA